MRSTIWKAAAAVFMGVAILATSCTEKEELKPAFPETQNLVKEAGGTVELTIAPNMAWELSLSAANNLFWFEEAGVNRSTLSGAAGETTVTIYITDEKPLGADYNCDVTMTMGGESKVIATIMVAGDTPSFKVYPAIWNAEANDWTYAANGYDYVYANEPATSVSLKFDNEMMNFICPAKVVANYAWSVPAAADVPWLAPVQETAAGTQEVIFTAKADAFPAGGAENAVVDVRRRDSETTDPETTLTVSIGDYQSIVVPVSKEIANGESILYSAEGNFDPSSIEYDENYDANLEAMINSIEPVAFYVADGCDFCIATKMSYGGYDNYVTWADFELIEPSTEPSGLIHEQQIRLFIRPNQGQARQALLLIKPADKADSGFFTSDWSEIAEGVISIPIEQEGASGMLAGPLAYVTGGVESLEGMSFELLPKSQNKFLYDEFGCQYVYKLISNNPYSLISFDGVPTDYTYEILSYNNATGQYSTKESWWIKYFAPEPEIEEPLSIKLDPDSMNYWDAVEDDKYAENQVEGFDFQNIKYMGAYLLIKDGDSTIAVVDCTYDINASFGSADLISFADEAPEGGSINVITVNDLPGNLIEAILGSYLYDASTFSPVNESYTVYEVRVPASTKSITLNVPGDAVAGYFIPEDTTWVTAPDSIDGGQLTFTFTEHNANIAAYNLIKTGMTVALIAIVLE